MPERDISSLCMWVSWGWTAWKYCSRRAAAVVALGLRGLPPIYTYIHVYIYPYIYTCIYTLHGPGPGGPGPGPCNVYICICILHLHLPHLTVHTCCQADAWDLSPAQLHFWPHSVSSCTHSFANFSVSASHHSLSLARSCQHLPV